MHTISIPQLSIIVPSFGCAGTINELIGRLLALENYVDGLELIIVDDASKDGSWQLVSALSEKYRNLVGIRLPRNRGQHYAVAVGIGRSTGKYVATIDCDLEFNPEEILEMIANLGDEVDCVVASARVSRDKRVLQQLLRKLFHQVMKSIYGTEVLSSTSLAYSFIAAKGETIRHAFRGRPLADPVSTKLLASDMQITTHPVTRALRDRGSSSYGLSKNLQIVTKSILGAGRGSEIFTIRLSLALAIGTFLSGACWLLLGATQTDSVLRDIVLLTTIGTLAAAVMGVILVLVTHLTTSIVNEIRSLRTDESECDGTPRN